MSLPMAKRSSVLTRPEHVQVAFRDSDKHCKAVDNNSGFYLGELLGQCVGLVSRERWKTLKSVVEGPFLHNAVTTYVDVVEQRTIKYLAEIRAEEKLITGLFDPVMDLKMLPFQVVSDIVDTYLRARSSGAGVPICKMYEAVDRGTISEELLLQTLDEMLFANLDVTMGGISWNLVSLASNPRVQERLRLEISEQNEKTKESSGVRDYLLSSSTYLAACVLESSRLKPLAAFSVPQSAPTDRTLNGFRIPAGTNFIVDSYALNSANPIWQPDPSTYPPK
ncbi:MAG: hypothetical protein Q9187_002057 [Circinaria calcarea]